MSQISDSFYNALPQNLRPSNKNQLTSTESRRILRAVDTIVLNPYFNECRALVQTLTGGNQHTKSIKEKVDNLSAASTFYTNISYDSCILFSKAVLKLTGTQKEFDSEAATACLNISKAYIYQEKYDSATNMLYSALDLATQLKDTSLLILINNAYSIVYAKLQNYPGAIFYGSRALKMYPAEKVWGVEYSRYWLNLASHYITFYRKTKLPLYRDSAMLLVHTLMDRKKDEAAGWYQAVYYFLGYLTYLDGDYTNAISLFDSGLLPVYNKTALFGVGNPSRSNILKGICMVKSGRYKEGEQLLKGIDAGRRNYYLKQIMYQALSEACEALNKNAKALGYYKQFKTYADSVNLEGQQASMFEAERKYAVTQKEAEIKTLENNNLKEKQAHITMLIVTVIMLAAMLITIALLYARNKKRESERTKEKERMINELHLMEQERELSFLQQQAEKEAAIISERKAISQNMHDEISSSLTGLNYLITHVKRNMSRQGAVPVEMLEEVEEEARAVYRQARDFMHALNRNAITESYNLVELLHKLEERFDQQYGLKINVEMNDDDVNTYFKSEQHAEMYRVVKEAVTNSIKHSGADVITIRIKKEKDYFYFDISDNGHGIEPSQSGGMGMATMKQRIEALSGNMKVQSDNAGTHITGTFPVNIAQA